MTTTKTILITGSTSGIGKGTAFHLASQGHTVLICSRNKEKVEEVVKDINLKGEGKAVGYVVDLANLNTVKDFCEEIVKASTSTGGGGLKVDTLLLNAGVSPASLVLTEQGLETCFGANHLAHMYMNEILLSKLPSIQRVVIVSSGMHDPTSSGMASPVYEPLDWSLPKSFNSTVSYSASKLANVLYGLNLAERMKEVKGRKLAVLLFDPGFIGDTGLLSPAAGMFQPVLKLLINQMIFWTSWWNNIPNQNSTLERTCPFLGKLCIDEEYANCHGDYFSIDHSAPTSTLSKERPHQLDFYKFSVDLLKEKGFPAPTNGKILTK